MAAVIATGASGWAQSASKPHDVDGDLIREIHPKPTPSPFPINGHTETRKALEFRAPEQMRAEDRALAESAQAEIARRAGIQGFYLAGHGSGAAEWGYEQAVCPVFPDYLVLEYSRDGGHGDVSLFSAVVPRGTASYSGHIRVIPVRRRSYSLWTPVASNALTLNDFNHLVTESGHGVPPDWLTLGFCYAALAGGHVRAALTASAGDPFPLFMPAKLTVSGQGGAQVHFVDVTPHADTKSKAMDWVLTFSQNGKLLKVSHTTAGELIERPLPATAEEKSVPVKGTVVDLSKAGN